MYEQPNSNNPNTNARNFRLENTLQTLRNMILNMQKQEKMGVPVDPVEKQLYANLGKELKALQGKDDIDFNTEASVLVRKITGAAPFPSASPFNQNPYASQPSSVNGYTDPFANAQPGQFGGQANPGAQQAQQGPQAGTGIPNTGSVPFNPLGNFKKFGQGIGPSNPAFSQYVGALMQNWGLTPDYVALAGEVAEILVNEHQFPMDAACEAGADSMKMIAGRGIKPDEIIGMRVIKGIAANGYGSYTPFGAAGQTKSPAEIFNEILAEGEQKNNPQNDNNGFGF